jgi:hypothetical protein
MEGGKEAQSRKGEEICTILEAQNILQGHLPESGFWIATTVTARGRRVEVEGP